MRKTASYLSLFFFSLFFSFYHHNLVAGEDYEGPHLIWEFKAGEKAKSIATDRILTLNDDGEEVSVNRVYFGTVEGTLFCFIDTGNEMQLLWKYNTSAPIIGIEVDRNHFVYISSTPESEGDSDEQKSELHCIDKDGNTVWVQARNEKLWGLSSNGRHQIFSVMYQDKEGSTDHREGVGYIACFKTRGGRLQWKKPVSDPIYGIGNKGDEGLYCATYKGDVFFINGLGDIEDKFSICNGKIKWIEVEVSEGFFSSSTRIYAGSDDGNLYCYDPDKKEIVWKVYVGGIVRFILLDAYSDCLIVSSDEGHIYGFSKKEGNKVGAFHHNNQLYCVASSDGNVFYETGGVFCALRGIIEK